MTCFERKPLCQVHNEECDQCRQKRYDREEDPRPRYKD